jgi:predicted transcriptional regulator
MKTTLFDSEQKLMELLWENEPVSAKELSRLAADRIGWNKNTTYTVIKKLVDKGVIRREEPGFVCHAVARREDVLRAETDSFVGRFFGGSKKALFSALLEDEALSADELAELKALIDGKRP